MKTFAISLSYLFATVLGAILMLLAVNHVHNLEPIPVPTEQAQFDQGVETAAQPVATSIQVDPIDYTRNHNQRGGVILEHRRDGKMEDGHTPLPERIGAPLPGNQSRLMVPVRTASFHRELEGVESSSCENCSCENCSCEACGCHASRTPLRTAAAVIAGPIRRVFGFLFRWRRC